jgi:hypothetical protein
MGRRYDLTACPSCYRPLDPPGRVAHGGPIAVPRPDDLVAGAVEVTDETITVRLASGFHQPG